MQLTQKDLAEALGLTPRRIRQLSADNGLFRAGEDKRYNLAECVREYIRFKVESATSGGNDLDYWEEKAKHEEAKRKITEMKLSRMKRESFDASDVEDVWAALLIGFKEELEAVPHKLAPLLIGLDDMAELDRMIADEIGAAFLSLSDFNLDKIESRDDMTEEDAHEEQYPENNLGAAGAAAPGKKANRKRVGGGKPKNRGR